MVTRGEINCRVCGVVSGVLLGLPNLAGVLAPVQFVAFLPVFYCVARSRFRRGVLLACGCYMALGFTVPQVLCLWLPGPITAVLLVLYITMMMILVFGVSRMLRHITVINCLAAAAFIVVLDWANYTAVPMWGTAQSIVRSWSAYPRVIAFTSITGMGGIVFLLCAVQSLEVGWVVCPRRRRRIAIALLAVVSTFAMLDAIALKGMPGTSLKVAAIGWDSLTVREDNDPQTVKGFENLLVKPVVRAAAAGAKLIVTPEMGFYVDKYDKQKWVDSIKKAAAENNVYLVVGYLDASINQNRMVFVDRSGEVLKEYTKTYLTPFEQFVRGDGMPKIIDVDGVKVGGMICQDDNFTSISRRYGNASAGIVAVPTLDWKTVRKPHMQNSVHRAIESRYGVVRAAYDGISAIISPGGEIIASYDHIKSGPGMVIADLEVGGRATVFNMFGNWMVWACAGFCLFYKIRKNWLEFGLN